MSRCLVALVLMCAGPTGARAQFHPSTAEEGLLRPPLVVSASSTGCLTELTWSAGMAVRDLGCEVVDSVGIGGDRGEWGRMYRYLRRAEWTDPPYLDTLELDELALARLHSPAGERSIVWRMVSDRSILFLSEVDSAVRDGAVLVSYHECVNGTGGCAQQFLLGAAEWAVVEQPYIEALRAVLPRGWRLHKGRRIDLQSLEGVQPISTATDANCCPSGEIAFKTALRNGRLVLLEARVTTEGSLPHLRRR